MLSHPYSCHRETEEAHRRMIRRVIDAMAENLETEISLEDMADVALVSPFHFNRTFKSLVGIPPCFFRGMLRIEGAKRLLIDSDRSVTEICSSVGFKSLGTFSRRFKELVGSSPRQFRSLAATDLEPVLQDLERQAWTSRVVPFARGLAGWVETPPEFTGLIFIGLFAAPVPQSQPLACTLLSEPGVYVLPAVPDGEYHLFAAGIPMAADARSCLLYEDVLRAGSLWEPVVFYRGRARPTHLRLRPPVPEDPPILMIVAAFLTPVGNRGNDAGNRLEKVEVNDELGKPRRSRNEYVHEKSDLYHPELRRRSFPGVDRWGRRQFGAGRALHGGLGKEDLERGTDSGRPLDSADREPGADAAPG